jgi:hypothetical protein
VFDSPLRYFTFAGFTETCRQSLRDAKLDHTGVAQRQSAVKHRLLTYLLLRWYVLGMVMAHNPEVTGSKPVAGKLRFFSSSHHKKYLPQHTPCVPAATLLVRVYSIRLAVPHPYLFARLHVIHQSLIRPQVFHSIILYLFHFHFLLFFLLRRRRSLHA